MNNFAAFCFTEEIPIGKVKKQHNEIEGKNSIYHVSYSSRSLVEILSEEQIIGILKKIQKKYNAIWVFWSQFLE